MQKQQANHTTSTVQAYSETQQAQNSCKMQTGQMGNTATSFLIDQEELQKRQQEMHKRQQDLQRKQEMHRQQEIIKHQGIQNEKTEEELYVQVGLCVDIESFWTATERADCNYLKNFSIFGKFF